MSESVPKPSPVMPQPSPELVLIAAMLTAYMHRLPKRKRMKFLAEISSTLDWYEEYAGIVRIRPKTEDVALGLARRQAAEWYRRMTGIMVSKAGD